MTQAAPHAWIEVTPGALEHNFRQVSALMGPSVRVIAVVKADGYGHGTALAAQALRDAGADTFAVTHLEEARALRAAGIREDILLLTPPRAEAATEAAELALACCVMDHEGILELSAAAHEAGRDVDVHLKIDTGMGRLGVRPDGAVELAKAIADAPGLRLAGVFSHCAEGAIAPSVHRQLGEFRKCCGEIRAAGVEIPLRHLAASAAALSLPEARLNAVRIGTLLYGQYPTGALHAAHQGKDLDLHDTWRFRSRIIAIRSLPPGVSVGYGCEYQTQRVSRIAVVPAGIADGLGMQPASLQRRGIRGAVRAILGGRPVLWTRIRGERAPVVGRVAMQMCCVDVTDIPEAVCGDVVDLPVRRLAASSLIPRIRRDG